VKEAELDGERVLVIGDEEIYAAGVVFESCAVRGGEVVIDALGYEADLKHALGFVVRDERGAEDLSQSALGVAAEDVHLPEAILRGDVALGCEEVVLVDASMWGTPWASRRTITGASRTCAERPARCTSPSSWGRAALAAERSQRTAAALAARSRTRRVRAVKRRMRGQRRLRGRRGGCLRLSEEMNCRRSSVSYRITRRLSRCSAVGRRRSVASRAVT